MSRRRVFTSNENHQNEYRDDIRKRSGVDKVDGFSTAQFYPQPPEKIPWKTLFFVGVFFTVGSICLILGILIAFGVMDEKYHDRSVPLMILGSIMLIPGGYYTYILISIYLKREGFGLHLLPSL